MQNENLNVEQKSPAVEKVSKKELKTESNNMAIENNKAINNFINTLIKLSDEDLDKALAFVNKKLELLKKIK